MHATLKYHDHVQTQEFYFQQDGLLTPYTVECVLLLHDTDTAVL